ncbi:protein of unknown function DUF1311 [Paraburkholderia atlantica]|uniref:DUF1311 domain-containing protein n=1 Tax=Paraburkholderia atlantica TaxID=2654982 RepID=D5WGX9_PARAM|nr:protein of unknown function DUF1311 [Paraburkholderia atlantica]
MSSRCPNCGSRNVDVVRSSSSFSGLAKKALGVVGFILVLGAIGRHSGESSSQVAPSAASAVEASAVVATPASDIASEVASSSVVASEPVEAASAASVEAIAESGGSEVPAIGASQSVVGVTGLAKTFLTSFDCAQASNDDEIAVCGDPGLAAQDRQLGQLYDAALKTISDPLALKKSESDWLLTRHMCNRDLECLRHVYGERIGQFLGSLGSKPLIPVATEADKPDSSADDARATTRDVTVIPAR